MLRFLQGLAAVSAAAALSLAIGCGDSTGTGGSGSGTTGDVKTTTSTGIMCEGCVCCTSDETPGGHYLCPTAAEASKACGGGPAGDCVMESGDCP